MILPHSIALKENKAYRAKSPVLLIIYNRPEVTNKVFEAIRNAAPAKLYIAADGPNPAKNNDAALCEDARKIIEKIDWECDLKTLFSKENKGCKNGVIAAVDWLFANEEEGIILEDDCVPDNSFFFFCDELLKHFRSDSRIATITGSNLQQGIKRGDASYYFSRLCNVWGWASWRRFWKSYDGSLKQFDSLNVSHELSKIFNDPFLVKEWTSIYERLRRDEIDTWDYQLQFCAFFNNALCITPNENLITNIGFHSEATHTNNPQHAIHANIPLGSVTNITHPISFLPEGEADYFFLKKEFYLEEKWKQYYKNKTLRRRIKRWLFGLAKNEKS